MDIFLYTRNQSILLCSETTAVDWIFKFAQFKKINGGLNSVSNFAIDTVVDIQHSMGDLETLKTARDGYDSIDRLRARLATYRNRHNENVNNCDPTILDNFNDSCNKKTLELKQQWLESKARKQSKPRTSTAGSGTGVSNAKQGFNPDSLASDQQSTRVCSNIVIIIMQFL